MGLTRRIFLETAAASLGLAAVSSCSAPASGGPAAPTNHQVQIKSFAFAPAMLDVRVGDTITFTNLDIVPHTATAKDGSWDTGNLVRDAAATIPVTEAMVGDYYCLYHPNMVAGLSLVS